MLKKVISNTTPIITLLGIGKLELLKKLYGSVIIPEAVYAEIEQAKQMRLYYDLSKPDWIEIRQTENKALVNHLQTFLDPGEAEVLALAEEIKADLLLLDEKIARNYAQFNDYTITGSFGILIKAKEAGYIELVKPLLAKITDNGIYISPKLIKIILNKANE